jgi:hypothetical protein
MVEQSLEVRAQILRTRRIWFVAAAACCWVGCSSRPALDADRKPVHSVKGKVLVAGKPAAGAFVLFVPLNEPSGSPVPRPRAETGEDGSFELFTYDEKDGAPVGDYKVTIRWPGSEESDRLQGRYADAAATKLRAKVTEGANELPPFALR